MNKGNIIGVQEENGLVQVPCNTNAALEAEAQPVGSRFSTLSFCLWELASCEHKQAGKVKS